MKAAAGRRGSDGKSESQTAMEVHYETSRKLPQPVPASIHQLWRYETKRESILGSILSGGGVPYARRAAA